MNISDIPVRVLGPGSQPEGKDGETLEYLDMPSDMAKYSPPHIPGPDEVLHLQGARQAMKWLQQALADFHDGSTPAMANLNALNDECRNLVNQILGEGEVSISRSGALLAKTQESVLAGVWRTLYFDNDENVCFDLLEVANIPHVVEFGDARGRGVDLDVEGVGPELSNALPILVEIDEHCGRYIRNNVAHSINLSLLPVSQAELEFLDERLGRGPVDILSRAYGRCQIISTMTPNVWWVRYYNSMGTLILNSIEVVNVPDVVAAAAEDLSDSAQRLNQILAPYWSDVA